MLLVYSTICRARGDWLLRFTESTWPFYMHQRMLKEMETPKRIELPRLYIYIYIYILQCIHLGNFQTDRYTLIYIFSSTHVPIWIPVAKHVLLFNNRYKGQHQFCVYNSQLLPTTFFSSIYLIFVEKFFFKKFQKKIKLLVLTIKFFFSNHF